MRVQGSHRYWILQCRNFKEMPMDGRFPSKRKAIYGEPRRHAPSALYPSRSEDSDARNVVLVNPFRCRVWALHDRLEDHITEDSCKEEIESIASHGQLIPVLGRPLKGDVDYDVEIIYGARRLFVTRHLNVPLHVEVREITDRDAIVAMDLENRHRKDISPYERGLSYSQW